MQENWNKSFCALFLFFLSFRIEAQSLQFKPVEKERDYASFIAKGTHGAIASACKKASEAGIQMFKVGGNAVDSAVAASFVTAVCLPQFTGLGGGGFMMIKLPKNDQTIVVDFRERAAAKASRNMYLNKDGSVRKFAVPGGIIDKPSQDGPLAVATPGLVAGLTEVQKKYGRLSLATVMAPAIRLAEQGIRVKVDLAHAMEKRADLLRLFAPSGKIFLDRGKPFAVDSLLKQPDLAATLRQISDKGRSGFYEGKFAETLTKEIQAAGGILTMDDLAHYRVEYLQSVRGTYRGYTIESMPPPSSGGVHIIEMLNMLENADMMKLKAASPERLHLLAEAMRRAYLDRAVHLGDPRFVSVPIAWLTDKDYARRLFQNISPITATPSDSLKAGVPPKTVSPNTTHLSVVGMMVPRWLQRKRLIIILEAVLPSLVLA